MNGLVTYSFDLQLDWMIDALKPRGIKVKKIALKENSHK